LRRNTPPPPNSVTSFSSQVKGKEQHLRSLSREKVIHQKRNSSEAFEELKVAN